MTLPIKLLVSMDEVVAFQELRAAVFEAIRRALATDGHCKSYEGVMQIQFPDYFEAANGEDWVRINLGCYVLGPTRHYQWQAATLGDAVRMATSDLATWIEELSEQERDAAALPTSGRSA